MAPDPKCTAVAGALSKSGLSYAQLAGRVGVSETRVTESQFLPYVCTGADKPTDAEFKSLAGALGLSDVPHTGEHSTK
ncbi:hypothetical protein NP233_g2391 [Leucocoprinus birnbaumii]|uniref:HTH cro/C1-type domain-containing protein n=1 Tax=Leucocoprinus birnbaumii TaxID=56174 RepID=A0AAD5YTS7_9AGAR|nr:hypothetical protein NP233_g2391 [Leucocoprinus birnbaumii]